MLTQEQNEHRMREAGIAAIREAINSAEEAGAAHRNPYAAHLFRSYVQPLAAAVSLAVAPGKGPGQRKAHAKLLSPLDPWTVAYLAVRCVIDMLSRGPEQLRRVGYAVGKLIHSELYLTQFKDMHPDLYATLAQDLGRRRSTDEDHRIAVFKASARNNGLSFVEWGTGSREQVGLYLVDQMRVVGMVAFTDGGRVVNNKTLPTTVALSDEAQEAIAHISEQIGLLRPMHSPCVEQPKDWTAFNEGGWHTQEMRRSMPYCVKVRGPARSLLRQHSMPKVLATINKLQSVQWKINAPVLDVVIALSQRGTFGEVIGASRTPRPGPPEWLRSYEKSEEIPTAHREEFDAWKGRMVEWYLQSKEEATQRGRFQRAVREANDYREYSALWFVWFADSRGRYYPVSQALSPQGSDLHKGLLQFANGDKLTTREEWDWFYIAGANKYGFDTAQLHERAKWWQDKVNLILECGRNPLDCLEWTKADNPIQFLAWCMEFVRAHEDPANFTTHLAVGMDGTCNGLQNFSAMLRDEVGGRATNLTHNPQRQDIYQMVADEAMKSLKAKLEPTKEEAWWINHGMKRGVPKRAVMTTPYGVTKRSAVRYVESDYLRGISGVPKNDRFALAAASMDHIWPSIGKVVVKATEAMEWLRAAGRHIAQTLPPEAEGVLSWETPSGFLATQTYYEADEHRIHTNVVGHARIVVLTESPTVAVARHATALPPNFVHSMDASHLTLTCVRMHELVPDAPLAMIHDDYGTTAKHAAALYRVIREEFVRMYEEHEPLQSMAQAYSVPREVPTKGNLDLTEVLRSEHFFS